MMFIILVYSPKTNVSSRPINTCVYCRGQTGIWPSGGNRGGPRQTPREAPGLAGDGRNIEALFWSLLILNGTQNFNTG